MGNRKVKHSGFGNEERRSSAGRSRDRVHQFVMVGVRPLKDIDGPFAGGQVQPLQSGVVEDVVGVAAAIQALDYLSRFGIKHEHLGWLATTDEEAVMFFIQ